MGKTEMSTTYKMNGHQKMTLKWKQTTINQFKTL